MRNSQKKTQPWYKIWFNRQDYLDLYKHRDNEDAKKIVRLIFSNISLPKNAKILDAACGNGRHSLLFAKKGYKVTGIDLSPYLIKIAKSNLTDKIRNNVKFEVKDMRCINYIREFDLAVNIFTSFGYFEKDKDNFSVIKSITDSIKPNGFFLLDYINKAYLTKNIVPIDIQKTKGKVIIQIRSIKHDSVIKEIFIVRSGKDNRKPASEHFTEKIKLYDFKTIKAIFNSSGLKIFKVFGDYNGSIYNKNNSPRLIILAKKVQESEII